MFCLEALAIGFFFTLGVELALGLCFALNYVGKGRKK